MRKQNIFKKSVAVAVAAVMIMGMGMGMGTTAFASEQQGLTTQEIQQAINTFSSSVDVTDGVTAIIYKDAEGKIVTSDYSPTMARALPYTPGDGVLEYAVFHLGFKNWVDTTGDLYWTITADEQLKTVAGSAYVKETTMLFPKTFYDDSWYTTLSPASTSATKTIADNIDVGNLNEVKVGFKNVTITLLNGRGGSFTNNSKVVKK